MTEDRDREILSAEYAAEGFSPTEIRAVEEMSIDDAALRAISRARAQEREAIVGWLREQSATFGNPIRKSAFNIAAASIERLDHLTPSPEGEGKS